MARWKIINSRTAEDLGIEEVSTDSDGFIVVDVTKLPKGLSVKDAIAFAEKEGIIMQETMRTVLFCTPGTVLFANRTVPDAELRKEYLSDFSGICGRWGAWCRLPIPCLVIPTLRTCCLPERLCECAQTRGRATPPIGRFRCDCSGIVHLWNGQ